MPDGATLWPFVIAATILLVIPGPSVFYIVARGIHQGRRAGLVSAWGVATGALVHVTAATLGLSALLVSSALAFSIVKYLGAAYLIYLGIRTLLAREEVHQSAAPETGSLIRVFRQGIMVEALNPKVALFFFAFLPQFIDPSHGAVQLQILFLGSLFVLMGITSDSIYALLSGTLGGWLKRSNKFAPIQRYLSGCVYIILGITTALAGADKK